VAGATVAAPRSLLPREESVKKPNIIYILADDLGYGELGCYGQEKISTPNLDRLAAEGMRFTDHYSGSAVCAPARMTLMTGKHIGHHKTTGQGQRLGPGYVTLPALLQEVGYATGGFGKWGLSRADGKDPGAPNQQGFDQWLGFISQGHAHFYYPEWVWKNQEKTFFDENKGLRVDGVYREGHEGTYIHDVFTEGALEFIRDNKTQPFFLYVPYTIPHLEMAVPDDSLAQYQGKFPEKPFVTSQGKPDGGTAFYDERGYCSCQEPLATYAAMVSRMDRDVGRIVSLVEELGLGENTLVMFSSDNGPANSQAGGYDREFFQGAGPLREGKGSLYEGGIRVPMIARWRGMIQAGSTTGHPSAFWDVLPTCAEAAGVAPPDDVDGLSFLPTLLGNTEAQREHDFLYWEFKGVSVVRMEPWKAIWRTRADDAGTPGPQLYNLAEDIGETTNLAEAHPDIVARAEQFRTKAARRRR
jgi:arylsulfatase A